MWTVFSAVEDQSIVYITNCMFLCLQSVSSITSYVLCSVACVVTLGNKRYESGIILQLAAYPHEKVRYHAVVVPYYSEEGKCTVLCLKINSDKRATTSHLQTN